MLSLLKKHPMDFIQWQIVAVWFLVALGQLQRWQITTKIAMYGHEVLMMTSLITIVISHASQIKKQARHLVSQLSWWYIILLGVIGVGWLWSTWLGASVEVALLYATRVAFYVIWSGLVIKYGGWAGLTHWTGWLLVGTAVGLLGLLQYLLIPDVRFLSSLGWDDHYYRLISSWFDPAFTGLVLAGTVIGWLWHPLLHSKTWGIFVKTAAIGCVVALALTFSRSSFLALGIGSGVSLLFMTHFQKKWLAGMVVLVILIVLIAPKQTGEGVALARTSTIVARTSVVDASLKQLKGVQWLIGRGIFVPFPTGTEVANPAAADHGRQADNSLIFSLVGLGVVGAALWWWRIAHTVFVLLKVRPTAGILSVMWLAHSFFNNSLFQPLVFLVFLSSVLALASERAVKLKT